MSRAAVVVAIALALAVSVAGMQAGSSSQAQGQPTAQMPPVFTAGASAVRVDVTVRDKMRRVVMGLKASDFVVLDNGVRQEVVDLSFGRLPIDVTIALDMSYSVTGTVLERLRTAIVSLMGDLGPNDRLKLMLFNLRVNRSVDFTTDVRAVERAIQTGLAGGGTALRDAISVALVAASSPNRRQLVVFFTDGVDSVSTTTPAMLQTIAERTEATVTFVMPSGQATAGIVQGGKSANNLPPGLLPGFGSASALTVSQSLSKLALDTGGSVLPMNPNTDLEVGFKRILEDFRSTYVLFFSPTGVERKGFHTIGVQVTAPGAVVQARRGYFGG